VKQYPNGFRLAADTEIIISRKRQGPSSRATALRDRWLRRCVRNANVTRSNWPNHRADAIADERSPAKAGRNEALACQSLVRHNHGHTRYCKRPRERKQSWGRIVNVASTHGLVASTHKAAYVAAKHGLVGLTKVVGLETAGSGVTCNAVCPGWVRTPLVEKQISDIAAQVRRRRSRNFWLRNSRL